MPVKGYRRPRQQFPCNNKPFRDELGVETSFRDNRFWWEGKFHDHTTAPMGKGPFVLLYEFEVIYPELVEGTNIVGINPVVKIIDSGATIKHYMWGKSRVIGYKQVNYDMETGAYRYTGVGASETAPVKI